MFFEAHVRAELQWLITRLKSFFSSFVQTSVLEATEKVMTKGQEGTSVLYDFDHALKMIKSVNGHILPTADFIQLVDGVIHQEKSEPFLAVFKT